MRENIFINLEDKNLDYAVNITHEILKYNVQEVYFYVDLLFEMYPEIANERAYHIYSFDKVNLDKCELVDFWDSIATKVSNNALYNYIQIKLLENAQICRTVDIKYYIDKCNAYYKKINEMHILSSYLEARYAYINRDTKKAIELYHKLYEYASSTWKHNGKACPATYIPFMFDPPSKKRKRIKK